MDISPELAALAAVSNPQTTAQVGTGYSPQLMQLLQAASGGGAATNGADAAALAGPQPGVAKRTASLNVPLPPAAPPRPMPTPNAPGPQGVPPTPNVAGPQGPPPTPNAPQGVPPALPPNRLIDPGRVMRPVNTPQGGSSVLDAAAAAGNRGDNQIVHATGGANPDVVVPAAVYRDPHVAKTLHAAFVAKGANPAAFAVGNRDASVNPATGLQEFGFMDMILPAALGLAGSVAFPAIAPEALAAFAPAIGGGIGSTIGSIATGVDPLKAAAMGFGGAAVGGAVGSMFPDASAATGAGFGGGDLTQAATTPGLTVGNPQSVKGALDFGSAMPGGAATAAAPPSASGGGFDGILNKLTNGKSILGAATSGLASMAASNVIGGLFPDKTAAPDPNAPNGPQLPTLDALRAKYARTYALPNYTTGPSSAADRTFFHYGA